MTTTERRVAELLQLSAYDFPAVPFAGVAAGARRRRRVRWGGAGGAVAVVAAACLGLLAARPAERGVATIAPVPQPVPSAVATSAPARPRVTFQGISLPIPAGWRVVTGGGCRADPRTIVIDDGGGAASCPAFPGPPPSPVVDLQTLYGPSRFNSWTGTRGLLDGQPAWTDRSGDTSVALPWLNARVTVTGSATEAAAILKGIQARIGTTLEVPATASSVAISTFRPDAVGAAKGLDRTVTDSADVRRLLADLRAEPLITNPGQACASDESLDVAVLTIGGRTFLARFGTCNQTTSGTGVAARSSAALRADIVRLLPQGGLH